MHCDCKEDRDTAKEEDHNSKNVLVAQKASDEGGVNANCTRGKDKPPKKPESADPGKSRSHKEAGGEKIRSDQNSKAKQGRSDYKPHDVTTQKGGRALQKGEDDQKEYSRRVRKLHRYGQKIRGASYEMPELDLSDSVLPSNNLIESLTQALAEVLRKSENRYICFDMIMTSETNLEMMREELVGVGQKEKISNVPLRILILVDHHINNPDYRELPGPKRITSVTQVGNVGKFRAKTRITCKDGGLKLEVKDFARPTVADFIFLYKSEELVVYNTSKHQLNSQDARKATGAERLEALAILHMVGIEQELVNSPAEPGSLKRLAQQVVQGSA